MPGHYNRMDATIVWPILMSDLVCHCFSGDMIRVDKESVYCRVAARNVLGRRGSLVTGDAPLVTGTGHCRRCRRQLGGDDVGRSGAPERSELAALLVDQT